VVTVPGVVGAVALGIALLTGNLGGFFGIVGIGAAFTRWVYVTGPLAGAVDRALQSQTEWAHRTRLDQLQRQLQDDPDARSLDSLGKLRQLHGRLQAAPPSAAADPLLAEVRDKSQVLYESCLSGLERVAVQGAAAREVTTAEARDTLLRSRTALVDEVVQGIERLGASVDQIQVSALAHGAAERDLAQIRNDLDAGLEVARRVRERMEEIERRVPEKE
jgi:hypothetical protein